MTSMVIFKDHNDDDGCQRLRKERQSTPVPRVAPCLGRRSGGENCNVIAIIITFIISWVGLSGQSWHIARSLNLARIRIWSATTSNHSSPTLDHWRAAISILLQEIFEDLCLTLAFKKLSSQFSKHFQIPEIGREWKIRKWEWEPKTVEPSFRWYFKNIFLREASS